MLNKKNCTLSLCQWSSFQLGEKVSAINSVLAGFTSLGFEKVRSTLLQRERNAIETSLQPIRDFWIDSSLSIVSDGWKDNKNSPLIKLLQCPPKGHCFLGQLIVKGK